MESPISIRMTKKMKSQLHEIQNKKSEELGISLTRTKIIEMALNEFIKKELFFHQNEKKVDENKTL